MQMMAPPDRATSSAVPLPANWVGFAVGALIALFLFVGRWAPSRIVAAQAASILTEPRLWVAVILVPAATASLHMPLAPSARRVALRRVCLLLALFLTWCIIAAIWAPVPERAQHKAYEVALLLVCVLACAVALRHDRDEAVPAGFWAATLAVGSLLAAVALVSYSIGPWLAGTPHGRLAVLGGGPNTLARSMGLVAIGCLGRLRGSPRPGWWLFGALLCILLCLLTGSRGGALGTAAGMFVYYLWERPKLTRVGRLAIVAGAVGWLAAAGTPLGDAAGRMVRHRFVDVSTGQRADFGDLPVYTAGRGDHFLAAIEMTGASPVLGEGLAGFGASAEADYPHNLFLEAACETGLVGATLLVLALGCLFAGLAGKRPKGRGAATAAMTLYLSASQFSGDFFDNRAVFLLALLAAASGKDETSS